MGAMLGRFGGGNTDGELGSVNWLPEGERSFGCCAFEDYLCPLGRLTGVDCGSRGGEAGHEGEEGGCCESFHCRFRSRIWTDCWGG